MLEARNLALLERRYQVWTLRKDGYTYHDIAQTLGISEFVAREDVMTIGKRLTTELSDSVDEDRQLQVDRLNAMLKKFQPQAEAGNLAAASMVLAIEGRRAKLLALDRPEVKRLDVTGIREYVGVDMDKV